MIPLGRIPQNRGATRKSRSIHVLPVAQEVKSKDACVHVPSFVAVAPVTTPFFTAVPAFAAPCFSFVQSFCFTLHTQRPVCISDAAHRLLVLFCEASAGGPPQVCPSRDNLEGHDRHWFTLWEMAHLCVVFVAALLVAVAPFELADLKLAPNLALFVFQVSG